MSEEKIKNIETELKSIDLRMKNLEAVINISVPDIQGAIANAAITIGTIINTLIDNKIVTTEQIQIAAEKVSKELEEDYKKSLEKDIDKSVEKSLKRDKNVPTSGVAI